MPDITTTVESSEATVKAVRQEIPVGVGGEAIARVPYSASLDRLLDAGQTTLALKGTMRCIRVVELAMQGGSKGKFHCSRPCVGVNGQQLCPDHDRDAFRPNQNGLGPKPEVTNSASIKLTKAELEEMGIKESPATVRGPDASIPPPAPFSKKKVKPRVKPVVKPKVKNAESISLEFTLEELEMPQLTAILVARICGALDELPAGTISRMKKVVALQQKIEQWGNA